MPRQPAPGRARPAWLYRGYPLSSRVGILYRFETNEAAFPASSRQADAIARAVFDSLKRR